jgi:hypothetical protein
VTLTDAMLRFRHAFLKTNPSLEEIDFVNQRINMKYVRMTEPDFIAYMNRLTSLIVCKPDGAGDQARVEEWL